MPLDSAGSAQTRFSSPVSSLESISVSSPRPPTAIPCEKFTFPPHERGMAHFSFPSPDHKWILVVEMNQYGAGRPAASFLSRARSEPNLLGQMAAAPPPAGPPMVPGCISPQRCKVIATCGGNIFLTDHPSKSPLAQPMTRALQSNPREIRSSLLSASDKVTSGSTTRQETGLSHPRARSWPTTRHLSSARTIRICITSCNANRRYRAPSYGAPT